MSESKAVKIPVGGTHGGKRSSNVFLSSKHENGETETSRNECLDEHTLRQINAWG